MYALKLHVYLNTAVYASWAYFETYFNECRYEAVYEDFHYQLP